MNKEKKFYITISVIFAINALATIALIVAAFLILSQKQASFAEKKYFTDKLTEKQQILGDLQRRYDEIEPKIPLIDNALPSEKESSRLLSDLSALAAKSRLKLTYMEPDSSASSGGKSDKKTTGDLSLLQTIKGANGYELPLEIRVTGSFKNLLSFIRTVENYQRLINIESITISKQESKTVADYIEARISIRAYLKK